MWILFCVLAVMIGCNITRNTMPAHPDRLVTFYAIPSIRDDRVVIALGIHNGGTHPLSDDLVATWELADPQGKKRNGGWLRNIPALPGPGEEVLVGQWSGELEPGIYTLTWGAPSYGSTVDRFEIVQEAGGLRIGEQESRISPRYPLERRRH